MEPTPPEPVATSAAVAPAPSSRPGEPQAPGRPVAADESAEAARLRLRRAPRYRAFVLTGVVLGVLAALVAVALAPQSQDGATRSVLGYLAVSLGALGALLGAAAALLVERRRPRR
jgi:protein-S-isoprenylcysteine O-methyltransferase Ste14